MERISGWLSESPVESRIAEMESRIARTQERLAMPGARGILGSALRTQLASQERELAELQRVRDAAMATARTEEERAAAGRLAAEAEQRAERISVLRADIEKEIAQFATAAEKRLAIDQGYAEKRQQLEAQRTDENSAEIDAALNRAAELHRRQLASLETRHKASAAVIADTTARLIEQMPQQLGTLLGFGGEPAGGGTLFLGARCRHRRIASVLQFGQLALLARQLRAQGRAADAARARHRETLLRPGDPALNRRLREPAGDPLHHTGERIERRAGAAGSARGGRELLQEIAPRIGEAVGRAGEPLLFSGASTADLFLQSIKDQPLRLGLLAGVDQRLDDIALGS